MEVVTQIKTLETSVQLDIIRMMQQTQLYVYLSAEMDFE